MRAPRRAAQVVRRLRAQAVADAGRRVRGSELAHAEGGGHVRGEEAGAHRDGFIGVEVKVQSSAVESLGEGLLDAGNARAAADGLDDLDVLQCDVKVREGLHDGLEGTRGAGEDPLLLRERLEILPRNRGPKVDILVHALDAVHHLLLQPAQRVDQLFAEQHVRVPARHTHDVLIAIDVAVVAKPQHIADL